MSSKYDFNLKTPLVFFDLETTGTNVMADRIVEICVAKLSISGELEVKTRRFNPEMRIPEDASAIHGIYDADVADKPTFKSVSSSFMLYLEGCDLAGFNIKRFDVPLLIQEFKRSGLDFEIENRKLIDMQTIYHKMEPRTLSAAYRFYSGKDLEDAHAAEADVLASIDVLRGQLEKYPDLPRDIDGLHEFCDQRQPNWIDSEGKFRWQGDVPIIAFGKNSGTPIKDIAENNPGFFKWMLNAAFRKDAMKIASDALQGKFPVKNKQ
ncbi:MAG: 3'-5' exonuclease [Kiritimatiellaeota bacterium]|nr:3'-5' exonuclease [Kiritimatiellota bacterium]